MNSNFLKHFFILVLVIVTSPVHAESPEEREFYGPYIKQLKKALYSEHDWFSHESLPAEINVRVTNVPNREIKQCTKPGGLHDQAAEHLDEMCRLKAFQYWSKTAVPRMREIAETRQNFKEILYKTNLSYQHLPEIGTSFRRTLILPSKDINPDSIDFRCIWALDAMMPHQNNPFMDTGRALSWFDSPENTGKEYYIEQCRKVVLDFATFIESTSKETTLEINNSGLIPFQDYQNQDKTFAEMMNIAWKPVIDLISAEKDKRLSQQDIEQLFTYIIAEKRHVYLEQGHCEEKSQNDVQCPGIAEYTNFRIRHISPPVEKISLKGLQLGMTAQEFYDVMKCKDTRNDMSFMPFRTAFDHLNTVGHENSNLRVLGDLYMSCYFHDMELAGNRIDLPVAIFNSENQLEFLAFTLVSPTTSNPKETAFYKLTEALKKKYPNAVADSYGFPINIEDKEARVMDTEGGHLIVFNEFNPIVVLVNERLVKAQPAKMKKLLEAKITSFKDYRDEL